MKKVTVLLVFLTLLIVSCSSNDDEYATNTTLTFNMFHTWGDEEVTKEDFDELKYVNANEDTLSISQYRYLLSNFYVVNDSGYATSLLDYVLIDLGEESNLTFTADALLLNDTYDLYFRFGFEDADNYVEGGYADLNTVNFNVGENLGGGYHYMQFDGEYLDNEGLESGFNYHAIRAVDLSQTSEDGTLFTVDTSYEVYLGEVEIEDYKAEVAINVDLSQWFESPNLWDLNVYNQMLMMNFEAQRLMMENAANVFSLVEEDEEDDE